MAAAVHGGGGPGLTGGQRLFPELGPHAAGLGKLADMHGGQSLGGGQRVYPELAPHPAGPGRPADAQAVQPAVGGQRGLWPELVLGPGLGSQPAAAPPKAATGADEEAPCLHPGPKAGGALGMLGYRFHRPISINWCGPVSINCMTMHVTCIRGLRRGCPGHAGLPLPPSRPQSRGHSLVVYD